jgi:hypothetical protein
MADALLTRPYYVLICVDVFVDGERAGGHGTFTRVAADMACKDILNLFLEGHAVEYYPLPDPTIGILMCVNIISDTVHQGKPASDVGSLQDRSVCPWPCARYRRRGLPSSALVLLKIVVLARIRLS